MNQMRCWPASAMAVTLAALLVAACGQSSPAASAVLVEEVPSISPTSTHVAAAAPTWTASASMIEPRRHQSATRLADGRVLVAGGIGGVVRAHSAHVECCQILASAELYDPDRATWAATGSMSEARGWHTATLLSDGRVLVAGGIGSSDSLASAELFDPVNGTWTASGPMMEARGSHTATMLRDGRVLVVGGSSSGASAELFDPVSGTWAATASMAEGRWTHTATLMNDDEVLVVGGGNASGESLASAELYDPSTGSWTAAGSMATGRTNHTATLLPDGNVLVAAGYGSPEDVLNTAELFDPHLGSWRPTGNMHTVRGFHTATALPDGTVLVVGGNGFGGESFNSLTSAELYDPLGGSWTVTASVGAARLFHTATLLADGTVLVVGGYGTGYSMDAAELYRLGSAT
jgi:hypothetical protein